MARACVGMRSLSRLPHACCWTDESVRCTAAPAQRHKAAYWHACTLVVAYNRPSLLMLSPLISLILGPTVGSQRSCAVSQLLRRRNYVESLQIFRSLR